jgi:hypothetical protein
MWYKLNPLLRGIIEILLSVILSIASWKGLTEKPTEALELFKYFNVLLYLLLFQDGIKILIRNMKK